MLPAWPLVGLIEEITGGSGWSAPAAQEPAEAGSSRATPRASVRAQKDWPPETTLALDAGTAPSAGSVLPAASSTVGTGPPFAASDGVPLGKRRPSEPAVAPGQLPSATSTPLPTVSPLGQAVAPSLARTSPWSLVPAGASQRARAARGAVLHEGGALHLGAARADLDRPAGAPRRVGGEGGPLHRQGGPRDGRLEGDRAARAGRRVVGEGSSLRRQRAPLSRIAPPEPPVLAPSSSRSSTVTAPLPVMVRRGPVPLPLRTEPPAAPSRTTLAWASRVRPEPV